MIYAFSRYTYVFVYACSILENQSQFINVTPLALCIHPYTINKNFLDLFIKKEKIHSCFIALAHLKQTFVDYFYTHHKKNYPVQSEKDFFIEHTYVHIIYIFRKFIIWNIDTLVKPINIKVNFDYDVRMHRKFVFRMSYRLLYYIYVPVCFNNLI